MLCGHALFQVPHQIPVFSFANNLIPYSLKQSYSLFITSSIDFLRIFEPALQEGFYREICEPREQETFFGQDYLKASAAAQKLWRTRKAEGGMLNAEPFGKHGPRARDVTGRPEGSDSTGKGREPSGGKT
jgi:hypothetical protein